MSLYIDREITLHTAQSRINRSQKTWLLWFGFIMAVAGVVGLLMVRSEPHVSLILWLLYLAGVMAIIYQPRYGVYLLLFLALAGDNALAPWYPFTKNFSSAESFFYLHDRLIINPLESYILLTFASWWSRRLTQRYVRFYSNEILLPALLFLAFVIFGLFYGIGTGGNVNIALWEARPLFYLVVMIILTSNLIETRAQASNLMWAAMLGIFVESFLGNYHFFVDLEASLAGVETITEHSAAIHMNTLFVFALAAWLFKASPAKRLLLPLMLPLVFVTYLATQRRAAFLTLGIALLFLAFILYRENRRAFFLIVPPVAIIGLIYFFAFWNVSGPLGLPVQAVKTIVAPAQASAKDQSSDIYRQIENVNLNFTMRQRPFTGVGFGQKFLILVPMADISFFEWWEYLPHNAIIWIWLKSGVGGFVAMLFLLGTALMVGARAFSRVPGGDLRAISLTAVLFIIMYFIYTYADIGWDMPSMVYVGAAMGLLGALERIVQQPVPPKTRRWPWQTEPAPVPALRPFSE